MSVESRQKTILRLIAVLCVLLLSLSMMAGCGKIDNKQGEGFSAGQHENGVFDGYGTGTQGAQDGTVTPEGSSETNETNGSSETSGTNGSSETNENGVPAPDGKQGNPTPGITHTVVLDPGHGEIFSGAVYSERQEKDLNLKIALYTKQYLEEHYDGIMVYLTRDEDKVLSTNLSEDLKLRVEKAENLGADILVSLHFNASVEHSQYGATVYVPHRESVAEDGRRLGDFILEGLKELGLKDNGVQIRNSNDTFDANGNPVEYYAISRHSADRGFPGIIVEHCFMDCEKDADFMDSEVDLLALAEADAKGIAQYFGYSP